MERPTLIPIVCCALFMSLSAVANGVALATVDTTAGSSVPLQLEFSPRPEPVAALQFDVDYDHAALELISLAGASARQAEKSVYFTDVAPSKRRFLILGWNSTAIGRGVLIEFLANVRSGAVPREYPLIISNLAAAGPGGLMEPLEAGSGLLRVTPGAAVPVSPSGLLSAASRTAGAVAPGEIVTLFGAEIGPAASLTFNGLNAPLLYAGPSQINTVVPFGLSAGSAEVVLRRNGLVLARLTAEVRQAAPALFSLNDTGTGPAAILNQDSTVNSFANPAAAGTIISIFLTGAGQMNPPGIDGEIAAGALRRPLLPVSVNIGGAAAEVLYAGEAPGLVAGVLQVNARIPLDAPRGPAVSVSVSAGDLASPPGATVSIR